MIKGSKHSEEAKAKMSAWRKGKATTTGYRFSAESKKRMREARLRYLEENPGAATALTEAARRSRTLLTPEEKARRAKHRDAYKRLMRRLMRQHGMRKDAKSAATLGYTKEQFVAHIEAQFTGDMRWGNIHIDHIVPVDAFFRMGIFCPKTINALINLRPLSPMENKAKAAKFDMAAFPHELKRIRDSIGWGLV